jgi:hypothetical protein
MFSPHSQAAFKSTTFHSDCFVISQSQNMLQTRYKHYNYNRRLTRREGRLVPSRFYKSGRAARSGRVEAHGKGERRNFSDWQITVIFLARKCFSCKLIFYASSLDFLTLVYINRSFYDVVSAKCVFLSSISAFNWSSLEYFKMADSDELRW